MSKADNTTGNEDVEVGNRTTMSLPLSNGRRRFGEKKKRFRDVLLETLPPVGRRGLLFSGTSSPRPRSMTTTIPRTRRSSRGKGWKAVQLAMQSFDVSDETFGAGGKVAEEEDRERCAEDERGGVCRGGERRVE